MVSNRPNTKAFSEEARLQLGQAVTRAREAAGYPYRPAFVADIPNVSISSLLKLESGKPVGPGVYEAVARKLPSWTEDTPVSILKGSPPPQTTPGASLSLVSDRDLTKYADLWNRIARMSYDETQAMAQYIGSRSGEDEAKRFIRLAFDIQEQARRENTQREERESVSDHK